LLLDSNFFDVTEVVHPREQLTGFFASWACLDEGLDLDGGVSTEELLRISIVSWVHRGHFAALGEQSNFGVFFWQERLNHLLRSFF
jgi:hypothetical protein